MLLTKDEMSMSLCTLVQDDYSLLNDILIDYVNMIDDNKFNGRRISMLAITRFIFLPQQHAMYFEDP